MVEIKSARTYPEGHVIAAHAVLLTLEDHGIFDRRAVLVARERHCHRVDEHAVAREHAERKLVSRAHGAEGALALFIQTVIIKISCHLFTPRLLYYFFFALTALLDGALTGCMCQILSAYSFTLRSEEKKPALAVLSSDMRAQRSLSEYALSSLSCASQ